MESLWLPSNVILTRNPLFLPVFESYLEVIKSGGFVSVASQRERTLCEEGSDAEQRAPLK